MSDNTETNIDEINSYEPPVNQLLTWGEPSLSDPKEWPDYLASGIGPEQIPELIRMATDETFYESDDDNSWWPSIHAWRALGQLRAEAAIEPLLTLFDKYNDDDWVTEELPEVYGLIGTPAIPALTAYLSDTSHQEFSRTAVARAFEKIGVSYPEARNEAIAALSAQLAKPEEDAETLNGFIISNLIELKAQEAAPVIEKAFAEDRIDESIAGDLEDVQIALGLREERETPRPLYNALPICL